MTGFSTSGAASRHTSTAGTVLSSTAGNSGTTPGGYCGRKCAESVSHGFIVTNQSSPILVVTGHARSGTSALTGAAIAGGVPGNYKPDQDAWILKQRPSAGAYHPNPKGFFEGYGVPFEAGRGMVVKMTLRRYKKIISRSPIKTLVMWRPAAERRLSLDAWGPNKGAAELTRAYLEFCTAGKENAEYRLLSYYDLLSRPWEVFAALVAWGWPLARKGAFIDWIDPKLYRNRLAGDVSGAVREFQPSVALGIQHLLAGSASVGGESAESGSV